MMNGRRLQRSEGQRLGAAAARGGAVLREAALVSRPAASFVRQNSERRGEFGLRRRGSVRMGSHEQRLCSLTRATCS